MATIFSRLMALSEPEPDEKGGCWVWRGSVNAQGYGKMMIGKVQKKAHRVAWEDWRGPIPAGMHVLHRCDNPSCINPAHLFLGTRSDNMRDMYAKGRQGPGRGAGAGEKHHKAKLTEEQVREIRASPKHTRGLSKKYGVSNSRISAIRNGESWSYLDE